MFLFNLVIDKNYTEMHDQRNIKYKKNICMYPPYRRTKNWQLWRLNVTYFNV